MKIKNLVKNHFHELLIVLGTGIFSYNVFNFSHPIVSTLPALPSLSSSVNPEYHYYNSTLFLIALGAMMVAIGILMMKNRQI